MADNKSTPFSLGAATIIAALLTGIATFVAARQTHKVKVDLPGVGQELLSVAAASNKIEELSRKLALAEEKIASRRLEGSGEDCADQIAALGRRIQSLEEQLKRSEPLPEPTSKLFTETKNGVRFDLVGCRILNDRVTCSGTITQARAGYNQVVGGSDGCYMWTEDGDQYPVTRVKLGAKEGWRADSDLPANVPTRVEMIFEGVPSNLRRIAALEIATYQQKFTFRGIALD